MAKTALEKYIAKKDAEKATKGVGPNIPHARDSKIADPSAPKVKPLVGKEEMEKRKKKPYLD